MSRLLTGVALSILVLAGPVFGQSEVGGATLSGAVTDPSGAAVPGVKLTITSTQTGFTRSTETTAAGTYNFARVPVGAYEMTADASGFKQVKRTGVMLSVGAVASVDISLEVGATSESITVSGDLPVIETTRSQTSTNVGERQVADLPVNGRNFLDFIQLTPGVNRDPRSGDLSFGGQRGTANSMLTDGGDSNNNFFGQTLGRTGAGRNPYSFSQDAVQEFQVNANGYAAEIGRAGGGVINVITKSGTNDFHGTAFWFFRDRELNANTFINNSRGIARQPYHFNQFGGNAGGPIKRNKLFFFADYDGQRNTSPNPVFLPIQPAGDALSQAGAAELQKYTTPYLRRFDNDVFLGKADWNIDDTQRLNVRYNASRFKGKNLENSGNQSAAEHTGDSNVTTDSVAANYSRNIGQNTLLDLRYVFSRDDIPGLANSTAPETVVREGGTTVMQFGRNNFSPRFTNARKNQVIGGVSRNRGRHSYKIGADVNFERIANFFPGTFSGVYTFNSYADFAARRPFSFVQAFGGVNTPGPTTYPNINEYAFFAQDSWRASSRLTLNYGMRYDLMDSADPSVKNPDSGLAAWKLDTSRMNLDTNNWAGRFGFAYRLTADNRHVLRGGTGIFYARTPGIMTGTAHSQNGIQVQSYELRGNLPAYPNVLSGPPELGRTPNLFVFAPGYVQPQTFQWNMNYEFEPASNYSVTIGYLGVRGVHLSRSRDINFFPAQVAQGTIVGRGPVEILRYPATRPNPNLGRITLFDSGADSIYHGGFVQLTKRYAQRFLLQTSYTWSKAIDTNPTMVSVVVGTDDYQNAQDTLRPNAERGRGESDVRQRFVFSGVWDITYADAMSNPAARLVIGGWQLGLITSLRTGNWFSATVSGDMNNNGQNTDRPPFIGRNTIEGPGFASLDARVTKSIPLHKERVRMQLILEAFNLANRANFSSFNRGVYNFNASTLALTPRTDYLARTANFDPRILQVAAKFTF